MYVDHVRQVPDRLDQTTIRHEFSFDGRVRLARASLRRYELSLTKERDTENSRQLHVADAAGRAIVHVYTGKKAKVLATGTEGPTLAVAKRLISEVFDGGDVHQRTALKRTIPDAWRQDRLRELVEAAGGAEAPEVKGVGEVWRYSLRRGASTSQVTLWRTGTCMVTGAAPAFDEIAAFLTQVLAGLANVAGNEPTPAKDGVGRPAVVRPAGDRWIGTDESGKGDYFGPLVSAAVFVDAAAREQLTSLGVRDSKKLKDARVRRLAVQVREAVAGKFKVTTINPAKYNELHAQFRSEGKSLNSLLAWGHTRSIEDLLRRGLHPDFAVVDQFADARYIEGRLMAGARKAGLQVVQYPKAESDIAVAAASILARDAFLAWMEHASAQFAVTIPKGASAQVVEVAKGIYDRGGLNALGMVAKLSFKTTRQVTGT